ncbi:4-alpha-glucanotransferase [Pseudomonas sp. BAY1663]|nr:4-alpha-glucanotransferase [Pseudomonas sp. BAY1663]
MSDERLIHLAEAAGLSIDWVDADGRDQRARPEVLRAVLAGLGLAAETAADIDASLEKLHLNNRNASLPPLLTGDQGRGLDLSAYFPPATRFSLQFENGEYRDAALDGDAQLPAIEVPGYHRLEIDDRQVTLAIAPPSCPTVNELAGEGAWGLTVQLYSLRRPGDGGIGDTQALESMARNAAAHGADAWVSARCMRCSANT